MFCPLTSLKHPSEGGTLWAGLGNLSLVWVGFNSFGIDCAGLVWAYPHPQVCLELRRPVRWFGKLAPKTALFVPTSSAPTRCSKDRKRGVVRLVTPTYTTVLARLGAQSNCNGEVRLVMATVQLPKLVLHPFVMATTPVAIMSIPHS